MHNIHYLGEKSLEIRREIVKMTSNAGSGHTGGSLGVTDILVSLYFDFLNVNAKKPNDENRDYFVLSNGHVCPALYAVLAHKGYFPKKELMTLRKLGSRLQGHPERQALPGLETTSGPLGSGIGQGAGMALGLRMDGKSNRVVVLTSDGEHNEGSTWEGVMFANKYNLNNLLVIIDRNRIQLSGRTEEVMPLQSLKEKYASFGWGVIEINGHNFKEILFALDESVKPRTKPLVIIANTVLGKGVSFMENKWQWHGKAPDEDELKLALEELE